VATETEVKLPFPGTAADARARIEQLGYTVRTPRTLESDQLFDRTDSSLQISNQILRLRHEDGPTVQRWTLTYKGPATTERYKSREEIETGIFDGDHLTLILARLGYLPGFRYEKYRTTFSNGGDGIVTIDETPMGIYLELEGNTPWIDETAAKLGFSEGNFVVSSYATLWKQYRERDRNAPEHMVFVSSGAHTERKAP
jgi:adenylate cyclase, class 2